MDRRDVDALRELPVVLSGLGYAEYVSSFNMFTFSINIVSRYEEFRNRVPNHLIHVIDLFLVGKPVPPEFVKESPVGPWIPYLQNLGLIVSTKSGWLKTAGLILLPLWGYWLFIERPTAGREVYMGDDSVAFLARLTPRRGGRCLDLCSGSGIQALHCASFAERVIAVEINPKAAKLAEINVYMNNLDNKVIIYMGDLWDPVRGQTFDMIIANPPFVPAPDELPYPFPGHGGPDGFKVTRRILQELPSHLSPDGTAQLIGSGLGDRDRLSIVDELRQWAIDARMDVLLTVVSRHPVTPGTQWLESLVLTACSHGDIHPEKAREAYEALLKETQATHICMYFIHIRRGSGRLWIQDLTLRDTPNPGLWFI